ncbi:hypothetical protein [Novosphingobium sp.]|jgi:hypothetical protein
MSIKQHIEELRAKLSNCSDPRKRMVITSELRVAIDALQQGLRGLGAQP